MYIDFLVGWIYNVLTFGLFNDEVRFITYYSLQVSNGNNNLKAIIARSNYS